MVRLGLEVLLNEKFDLIRGKRVGLITNHTGVDSKMRHNVDLFREAGVNLVGLYGPEHGIRGEAADGAEVGDSLDARTGIPVHSLYGHGTKPTPEMLKGVEVLVYDLQDVTVRFYTYLYTMSHCMEAAGENGIPFVVLDRPAPLGGIVTEGPVLDPAFKSFVGLHAIPNRTGLTVGEKAKMFNEHFGVKADLTVVPMDGWKRSMWFDQTGIPWVIPSPNLPTLESAYCYPGTCVFEGTWCSEGRGMGRPFETIGAPWMDGQAVAKAMNALNLPGVIFREHFFMPTASKHKDVSCGGVQFHVIDRNAFQPVRSALHLLCTIKKLHADKFEWRIWTPGEHYGVDRLWGSNQIRLSVEAGMDPEEIIASWQPGLKEYTEMRKKYFLYE